MYMQAECVKWNNIGLVSLPFQRPTQFYYCVYKIESCLQTFVNNSFLIRFNAYMYGYGSKLSKQNLHVHLHNIVTIIEEGVLHCDYYRGGCTTL